MNKQQDYEISIIPIGSIQDYKMIFDSIELLSLGDKSFKDNLIKNDIYNIRTESTRKRFFSAINSNFLSFINNDHELLIKKIFTKKLSSDTKNLILFWQFSLLNKLFREINNEILLKYYSSGLKSLNNSDLIDFLRNKIQENPYLKTKWSESTFRSIISKYLTLLRKLDLAEGIKNKRIKSIYLSNESLVIFICLLLCANPEKSNILENSFLPFSFLTEEDFIERVKKLALQGIIQMSFNGKELKIEKEIDRYIENVF